MVAALAYSIEEVKCPKCKRSYLIAKKNIHLEPTKSAAKTCKNCGTIMPANAQLCGIWGS